MLLEKDPTLMRPHGTLLAFCRPQIQVEVGASIQPVSLGGALVSPLPTPAECIRHWVLVSGYVPL